MIFLPLAKVPFIMSIVAVLFFLVAIALILLILIQKGKGGGLSGAFGGGSSSSVFGSKTGDVLTWATIVVVAIFLILAVVLTKFYKPAPVKLGGPEATQTAPAQKEAAKPAVEQAAPATPNSPK